MDEFFNLGQERFWAKWSRDGVRCCSSNILQGLKEERRRRNDALANEAKLEYGADFGIQFAYKKGCKSGVCVRNSDIARRYKLLKVLEPH
jgi:hypothetical protein